MRGGHHEQENFFVADDCHEFGGERLNYANAKVPRDEKSLSQFFHQMTPSFPTEQKIIVDAMIAVFETKSLFSAVGEAVPMEDFLRLTEIPIVLYFGDNIPSGSQPVANRGQDNWRTRLNLARKWAQVVNKYGGGEKIFYNIYSKGLAR